MWTPRNPILEFFVFPDPSRHFEFKESCCYIACHGVYDQGFVDRIPALVAEWKPFHLPIRDDALRTVPAAIKKELRNDPDLIFGRYIWDPWPVEAKAVEAVPRRIPPQLERRQEEMRARNMGAAVPQTIKLAKNLSPLQKKLAENKYTPEELSALGPSAETIRRLFKSETEGINRLPGPSGKYDTMWISESAVFRVLGRNFFSAPKHKRGTRFRRRG